MAVKPPAKDELDRCRRCRLGEIATQGVPGEGPRASRMMLVGEQPGDEEDVKGRPFVGPAGRLLRNALAHAGVDADGVWITNAVKHFSFELRGKRRIHKTPAQREVAACHVWLEQEMAAVRPSIIVALGATALGAVMGKRITITEARTAPGLGNAEGLRGVAT
jgi:DNA polymerase